MYRWQISTWEKLNIISHTEIQIKATVRYHYTPFRKAKIPNSGKKKCWGAREINIQCWWQLRMVQPVQKIAWQYLTNPNISSAHFSRSVVSDSLWPHELQDAKPPCPSPTPRACSNSCPLVSDAIQPSHLMLTPSFPALNLSQHQSFFKWVSSLHQVAKVLEFQLQHYSFQWTLRTDPV